MRTGNPICVNLRNLRMKVPVCDIPDLLVATNKILRQ